MVRSTSSSPAIVWFRDDLRLADNPALHAAARSGRPLLCLFVLDDESKGLRPLGGAARWWLHGSLVHLQERLTRLGGGLLILKGRAGEVVENLAAEARAGAVYWNRRYDEAGRNIDAGLKIELKARGVDAESFNSSLLHEPWTIKNKSGSPFKVFTAYWRAARSEGEPASILAAPKRLSFHPSPTGLQLADLHLLPTAPDWAAGLRESWVLGEVGAGNLLKSFLTSGLQGYAEGRDFPDRRNISRLSPYLRFGNISPRQIWQAARNAELSGSSQASSRDMEKLFSELGWRDFNYHLLYHQPDLARVNVQSRFNSMPWRTDKAALRAWQRGLTGYPIVDAGMRELWTTGFMHNRVRMITASFLTKHLLIDWRKGEEWFWDTLVDADPASNPANWQWVAGTGADAAPYFRIFNPTLQGEKFDPDGAYVKRWVPELKSLPASLVHKPWMAADMIKGGNYPAPVVDHNFARKRALEASKSLG